MEENGLWTVDVEQGDEKGFYPFGDAKKQTEEFCRGYYEARRYMGGHVRLTCAGFVVDETLPGTARLVVCDTSHSTKTETLPEKELRKETKLARYEDGVFILYHQGVIRDRIEASAIKSSDDLLALITSLYMKEYVSYEHVICLISLAAMRLDLINPDFPKFFG